MGVVDAPSSLGKKTLVEKIKRRDSLLKKIKMTFLIVWRLRLDKLERAIDLFVKDSRDDLIFYVELGWGMETRVAVYKERIAPIAFWDTD